MIVRNTPSASPCAASGTRADPGLGRSDDVTCPRRRTPSSRSHAHAHPAPSTARRGAPRPRHAPILTGEDLPPKASATPSDGNANAPTARPRARRGPALARARAPVGDSRAGRGRDAAGRRCRWLRRGRHDFARGGATTDALRPSARRLGREPGQRGVRLGGGQERRGGPGLDRARRPPRVHRQSGRAAPLERASVCAYDRRTRRYAHTPGSGVGPPGYPRRPGVLGAQSRLAVTGEVGGSFGCAAASIPGWCRPVGGAAGAGRKWRRSPPGT